MKTTLKLSAILFFFVLVTGCGKGNQDTPVLSPEETVAKMLTGDGNRYWHLKALILNGTAQSLTDAQLQYTKTYTLIYPATVSGKFTDSDFTAVNGTWKVINSSTIREEFLNQAGNYVRIDWDITSISENKMDVSYILNNTKTEEIFYAY